MELTIVLSIISVIGTVSSISFAYLAFRRNTKIDDRTEAKNAGVLISDIGYIKSSIDRIEKSLDKLEERYADLSIRVSKLEESVYMENQRLGEHISDLNKHGGK